MTTRREILSTAALVGLAGCTELEQELGISVTRHNFIDKIEWGEEKENIWLQDDHDSHGFAILHEHHSDPTEHSIVYGATPDFSGPLEIPFMQMLRDSGNAYPSPTFVMQFWTGNFSDWDQRLSYTYFEEQLGTDRFTVPEEHRDDTLFHE